MGNFADAIRNEAKWTRTENGAVALKDTGDACLNFFAVVGALRNADETRVETLYEEAYREDPLLATKILFYARDIRGGLGERKVFNDLLHYASIHHPESIVKNIELIPEYGRFDDWYSMVDTPLEKKMWDAMDKQLNHDYFDMTHNKPISLLAKWVKSCNSGASPKTRELGEKTAKEMGLSFKEYRKIISTLRRYIDVTECKMSENEWETIKYSSVPSRAMMNYRNAFVKHDEDGFNQYLESVKSGKTKINSSTLYPYDLIEKYLTYNWSFHTKKEEDAVLEEQWKALPNYVEENTNALVICDTSGSMSGRPICSAVGLAIYFAERNKGIFHNLFMEFSSESNYVELKGETLKQKIDSAVKADWYMSTNLASAFAKILKTAVDNQIPADEMPKALIVISDMEIDHCGDRDWSFYDREKTLYEMAGYEIPHVIFWNVESRHDIFHADAKRKGVTLVSGQSTSTFKNLMSVIGKTPYEAMLSTLNSDRYAPIQID